MFSILPSSHLFGQLDCCTLHTAHCTLHTLLTCLRPANSGSCLGSNGRVFLANTFPGMGDTPGVAPPPSCVLPPPFPSLPCPLLFFLRGIFFHLMKARTLDIQPVLAVELPVLLRDVVPCWGIGVRGWRLEVGG